MSKRQKNDAKTHSW